MQNRQLVEIVRAQPTSDGAGVKIQRIAGMAHASMDPVLMIDELRSEQREDFAAGFPPHPHRGMQTLTYMKHGGIIHEDSQGNRGEIRGGGVQWMSAGRGIIHSEMPTKDSRGLHGFQLWFNLPAAEKMLAPRYRDIPVAQLAMLEAADFSAVVIAGEWLVDKQRATGPLQELVAQACMLDLRLGGEASAAIATDAQETVMVYIYDGSLIAKDREVGARHLLLTDSGAQLTLRAGASGAGVLVLRGKPLREPVAHYGPFVMNTQEEIEQALRDYQSGNFAA